MSKFFNIILFLFILFCVGFTFGTITLVGIVEPLVAYIKRISWHVEYERTMVNSIIIIYLIYSFLFSIYLFKVFKSFSTIPRVILFLILAIATSYCLWYWFHPKNPTVFENRAPTKVGQIVFVIGPYPQLDKMKELKKNGFTGVVSLLSPLVFPFETHLISKEHDNGILADMPIINIPMLPWVSSNSSSVELIKDLMKKGGNNKYYVHCYFGRDRVGLFMDEVNKYSANQKPIILKTH